MIVYLAGFKTIEKIYSDNINDVWLLSSFWEHKSGKFGDYVYQKKHILDSGAFSTFKNIKDAKNFNWNLYIKNYINFIKQTGQKLFFELDIDVVVGLQQVEIYRKQIEDAIGIQPIPVWHSNRGWDYFLKMCEEYPYVALGTTSATNEGKKMRANPQILNKFIFEAHKRKKKIHGLGFTSCEWLKKLRFDSVDSTTWNVGGKFGNLMTFPDMSQRIKNPNAKKYKIDTNKANLHNFNEWVKFQRYAEAHL